MSKHNRDYLEQKSEIEEVNDNSEIEVEETAEPEPEPMYGRVYNTDKLNVREKPDKSANVVCTINRDNKVLIDENLSTDAWYSICTENGIEGFCMKDFICQFFKTES